MRVELFTIVNISDKTGEHRQRLYKVNHNYATKGTQDIVNPIRLHNIYVKGSLTHDKRFYYFVI